MSQYEKKDEADTRRETAADAASELAKHTETSANLYWSLAAYLNKNAPANEKVDELLRRMILAEGGRKY